MPQQAILELYPNDGSTMVYEGEEYIHLIFIITGEYFSIIKKIITTLYKINILNDLYEYSRFKRAIENLHIAADLNTSQATETFNYEVIARYEIFPDGRAYIKRI